jgi:hypothetical protein
LDQEALRIFEYAYELGLIAEAKDDPPVTFTTVIAALLAGQNDSSRWFAQMAKQYGPFQEAVLQEKNLDRTAIEGIPLTLGKPQPVRLSKDKHLLTASARALLGNAEGWAQRVGGSDIGVRHLIASVVVNPPPAHRDQLQNRWGFQETRWRPLFFAWVADHYTAEQWMDVSNRPSPAAPIPSFEQPEIKGSALAFPGDPQASAVLELAAEFHARRPDRWLRLQTVFHALIEKARIDASVAIAIPPIAEAVNLAGYQYQQAFATFFSFAEPTKQPASFEAVDISPRVLNALETARELAVATRRDTSNEARVGVLHLAGALLSRRVDGDNELAAMGLQPQALRLALIREAESKAESGEIWREALGEDESLQAGRPLDLNSDEPEAVIRLDEEWRTDPLAIRRDVETFGALLASRSLQPPLSIGLFGPWGSGKTTFLKRLRRVVERRAIEAKNSLAATLQTPYVSEVVHVDFNAWHFAEDALISSLVDTILRAVNDHIQGDKPLAGNQQQQQSLDKLETTKRKVEAAKQFERIARKSVSAAETAFVAAGQKAADAATSFQAITQDVWAATRNGFVKSSDVKKSGILDAIGETVLSAEELGDRVAALRARPARLLSDLGWAKSLIFAALVLVVPPLLAWLIQDRPKIGLVPELLASLSATLSIIGLWTRAAAGAVARVDQAVTKVADEYAKRIAGDKDVIKKRQELEVAGANLATAEAGLEAAREELARASTAAANATIPAQMLQLASSRIDAQPTIKSSQRCPWRGPILRL